VRWLIVKDLQILRRSPLLVGLLVVYPVVIALMIGFALSSPPGKPKVAFYNEVPPGKGLINLGSQHINLADYVNQLFESVQPIKVHSRDEAVAKVRDGEALAALVIPSDLPSEIANLVNNGVGNPTVELILNTKDPVEREYVNQAIQTRLGQAQQAISRQVLGAATSDLRQVLNGGQINFAGQNVPLLGLRASRAIVQHAVSTDPDPLEGQGTDRRVVGPEQPRALAHGGGSEAGTRPVGGAAVERDAHDGDVPAWHRVHRRQAGERGGPGETGDDGGVGRADGARVPGHQSSMAWYTSARSCARNG